MIYQYSWRDEDDFAIGAQAVGERLTELADASDGALHPRDVVADARRDGSPLHPLFEWDDRKAAVSHRLTQARQVIASIVVHVVGEGEDTLHYVHRAESELAPERYVAVILRDGGERYEKAPVSARARSELERWIRRYRPRPELADAVRSVEDALLAIEHPAVTAA